MDPYSGTHLSFTVISSYLLDLHSLLTSGIRKMGNGTSTFVGLRGGSGYHP